MLLIFDIDGTLFTGHRATVPAVREAFTAFGLVPPHADEITRLIGTSATDYASWLKARCVGVDPVAVIADTNRRELHHVHVSAGLYPGALELLHAIRNEGHVIATATNAPRDYFDAVLDGHGLRALVDLPMCLGDGYADKSAMVARATQKSESRPAVVIGDRRDDIVAAHANGAFAIGARYGYGADGELADADAWIDGLAEVAGVLTQIGRTKG